MNEQVIARSEWIASAKLIITQISGKASMQDVEQWEASLQEALAQVPEYGEFKIFVNLYGFKAENFEVHKRFRNIVPLTLAEYGWRVGYLGLFEEEAKSLVISNKRGITCLAAVHCHQDETKIALYDEKYSSDRERFFIDPVVAGQWIREWVA
ncbi:hypothetical protein KJS94_02000 [Flavihumibacter rivuli]|uniref:hypothetical protein n=1 Tax=Flavihumibacter rivuli TaxID=2838156 RepID=UPI001BDDF6EB|nr:hypothetical protein [Flavihumibacter rivuli]ULQ56967.1 hypothetical protein KJS94_02000 [Flavihumibacter rivuli]